ncbi:MAG: ABC transporter permease subunit [Actinobacteria bacterium]|nr:ABC transporter permease subunit [Actinomycetota bacterium]
MSTTVLAPSQPNLGPDQVRFGQLLRAEWVKFRTVRGWSITMIVAGLITVFLGTFAAGNVSIGCQGGPNGPVLTGSACTPHFPIGPDGEAVSDSYYFARQPLTGNGSITARVTSLTGLLGSGKGLAAGPNPLAGMTKGLVPWAKAGLILTSSTRPGSEYSAMMVTGAHGVRMQDDYVHDTAGLTGKVTGTSPRWLRLTRSGNTVTGYDSADGSHWTMVGIARLTGLPQTVQAGMFATSPIYTVITPGFGSTSASGGPSQATAVFDHINLSGNWSAQKWAGTNVGSGRESPGTGFGYLRTSGGAVTVSGSGDIAPVTTGRGNPAPVSTFEQSLAGLFAGLIAIVVVAAMFFTVEYRRGLIRTTLAASPRRGRVLAAKAVVVGVVAFVVGLAASILAISLGLPRQRNQGTYVLPVSTLTEVRVIVGTAAMVALAAVLAVAIGAILRRSAAAVTTVIVVIVLPFLLSVTVLTGSAGVWLLRVTPAAGFAIQQSIPNYPQVTGGFSPADGSYPLPPWGGFAVLCAWTAMALTAAYVLLRRRDA